LKPSGNVEDSLADEDGTEILRSMTTNAEVGDLDTDEASPLIAVAVAKNFELSFI
jgi:hypothetical protein